MGSASLITFGSPVDTRQGMPVRDPRTGRGRARRGAGARVPRWRRLPPGSAATAFGCSTRSSPRATGSSSCSSSTIARRCFRASASAASSRRTAGWRGPAQRWPSSCNQFVAHNRMLEGGFVIERPAAQPGRRRRAGPVRRRDGRRNRAGRRRARDPPGGAPRRRLRARAARGALRSRRRLGLERGDLADGGGLGPLAIRRGRGCPRTSCAVPDDGAVELAPAGSQRASATASSSPPGSGSGVARSALGAGERAAARRARAVARGGRAAPAAGAARADPAEHSDLARVCSSRSAGAARPTRRVLPLRGPRV